MIDPVALRAGLIVADKRRKQLMLRAFANAFLGVCRWSESLDRKLDKSQTKAGWSWFT